MFSFNDLKKSVQQISKKNFTKYDLQQILTIIPDFYPIQWMDANY